MFLEIVRDANTVNKTHVVIAHHDSGQGTIQTNQKEFDLSVSGAVMEYGLVNFTHIQLNTIQSNSVEVTASHPLTMTLVYERGSTILRTLLLPSIGNDVGNIQEEAVCYTLISSSSQEYVLSIVSMDAGNNHINISFNYDYAAGDYIMVDSIVLWRPTDIQFTLSQYQSANIWGRIDLDGTQVCATQEVAVYVIGYGDAPKSQRSNVTTIYQAFPVIIASHEYATFPSYMDVTLENDIYKVVTIHDYTSVKINGNIYRLPTSGTVKEINLPKHMSFLASADHPFHMYKIFNNTQETDRCLTQLIPSELWRTEYTLSAKWMVAVNKVHIHLILDHTLRKNLTLDGNPINLTCINVTDSDGLVACLVVERSALLPTQNPSFVQLRLPSRFGAYLSWLSGEEIRCQSLGINWDWGQLYGLWNRTIWPEFTTTTTHSTTTNTTEPTTSAPVTTTTSAATTQSDTTTRYTPSNNHTCPHTRMTSTNLTLKEIEDIVDNIRITLHVDATQMSFYIRKKTSAKDTRPSSSGLGYFGLAFFVIVFGVIVLLDVVPIFLKLQKQGITKSC